MNQLNPQNIKAQVDDLLGKEVDRKDFLKHVGIGLVAMTGALGVIKALNGFGKPTVSSTSDGYGTSAYGGKKTS